MEENKNILKEDNKQELVPSKNNTGLIIGLVIIILLLSSVLVYLLFFNKEKEDVKDNKDNNTQEVEQDDNKQENENEQEKENEQESNGDYTLDVYVVQWEIDGQIFGEYTEDGKKFTIKVESPKAKFISSYYDRTANFFIYDDNGLKLYDIKKNKSTKLNLKNVYKDYYLNLSEDEKSVIGISCRDSKGYGSYYNISLGKELYKGKYKLAEDKYITNASDDYISVSTSNKVYLLSANEEKQVLSHNDDSESYWKLSYTSYGDNENKIYVLWEMYDDGTVIKELYSNKMNKFYSGELYSEYSFSYYKGNVYIIDNNSVKKYNANGELLKTNNYNRVMSVIDNYTFIIKDGSIYIENIDDEKETKEICTWNNDWDYDSFLSHYYTRKELDAMNEKNKKEGIYFVFYYGYDKEGNAIKDGKGNYGMEYCYTKDKQVVDYPIKQEMGGRGKPVLYLYPKKETNVKVSFSHPEYLTTTYPKYINSWNVTVKPNGDIMDKDGKYYYALYWDEVRYDTKDFSTGFYVESKDAIKFLEEKLTIIGLNDRERNEFIMYWLPIMERNGKNLVYFELTKERELGNKLIIEPKPDSLLRVNIHVKKVNEKVNIKEEKLETFTRTGFTVVEWGGMTY